MNKDEGAFRIETRPLVNGGYRVYFIGALSDTVISSITLPENILELQREGSINYVGSLIEQFQFEWAVYWTSNLWG